MPDMLQLAKLDEDLRTEQKYLREAELKAESCHNWIGRLKYRIEYIEDLISRCKKGEFDEKPKPLTEHLDIPYEALPPDPFREKGL